MPALTITITIPASQAARVKNGMAKARKKIDDGTDQEEFLRKEIQQFVKRLVHGAEANDEMETLRAEIRNRPDDLTVDVT